MKEEIRVVAVDEFQTPSDRGGASDQLRVCLLWELVSGFKPLLIGEVLRTGSANTDSAKNPKPECFKPLLIGEVLRTSPRSRVQFRTGVSNPF